MKSISRKEAARLWTDRIQAAEQVYKRQYGLYKRLEDGLAGHFPTVMPPHAPLMTDGTSTSSSVVVDDQIEENLLLWASNYMVALCFDELPSLKFSRQPDEPEEVIVATERVGEMLLDEGEAMAECRRATRYLMTRGSWIVWPIVAKETATPEEIRAGSMNAADFIEAARAGTLEELPEGADYYAIGQAARAMIEQPEVGLGLTPEEAGRIAALAEACEVAHAKSLEKPHRTTDARISFVATPYGAWCLWDSTVTDHSRAEWIARKIVLDREEFQASPLFTSYAKANVNPTPIEPERDPSVGAATAAQESEKALEEYGRIVVWEIWDRKRWKRWYWTPGCDETIGADESYPYLDEEGRPVFRQFYPCVIRVPIRHNQERAEQSTGVPYLAPGWTHQIELIQFDTAASRAVKRSGRVATAASGIDAKWLNLYTQAADGAVIPAPSGYEKQRQGDILTPVQNGPFPREFFEGSTRAKANFATSVSISLAALTGEPVADTLGQEEIALKGSSITQADVVRSLESGTAELARNALLLFKAYASDAEKVGYLGKKSVEPLANDPMGRTLLDAFKGESFDGRKLQARFASSLRSAELAEIKLHMDFLALANTTTDSTGMRYFDPKPMMLNIAKLMDIDGLTEYVPSPTEMLAAALMKVAAAQQGSAGPAKEGGGDPSGRKAGGERGAPAVPNRQQRNREPASNSQMTGNVMRPANGRA